MPKNTSRATAHIPAHTLSLKQHGSEGTIEIQASYDGEELGMFKVGRSGVEHKGKRVGWPRLAKFLEQKGKKVG